ncbi:tetratricopeptide repeat protein [Pseudogracilibacillus sp. SO30301A]|uniref:tetratricopeptide repeat protein n=1 Tax=Pseudogracilibacillus sp. SO30301A TaxID=3098291 RepID=UPI00300DD552
MELLNARHHPKHLQSISKAEELLNEAFNAFQNEEPSFHKIFNRNGYALKLYRKGKIEEAIKILLDGISKLQKSKLSNVDNGLHESVLTYNLAQCYVNLNRFEEASSAFERLISMDPYYPENHLEYAKYLINNEKYDVAYKHLTYAKDLNPYIPETHSYLGIYYLAQDSQFQLAKESFKNAYILSNKSYEYLYDLLYTHTLENDYEKCYKLIKDHPYILEDELIEDFYVNISIIEAECLLNIKSEEEATAVLKLALKKYPRNKFLLDNEKKLCKETL